MGSSRTDDWPTDPKVFAELNKLHGPFTLDVCASVENAKCERFFTRVDDGLAQEWSGPRLDEPALRHRAARLDGKGVGGVGTDGRAGRVFVPALHRYALVA